MRFFANTKTLVNLVNEPWRNYGKVSVLGWTFKTKLSKILKNMRFNYAQKTVQYVTSYENVKKKWPLKKVT